MNHLMTLFEIKQFDKNNNLIFESYNIKNILHNKGEEYMLKVLFGTFNKPDRYYLGLDDRQTLQTGDTMNSSLGEPVTAGYQRQEVLSSNFTVGQLGQTWQANSPVVLFRGLGGSWSARNIFLATSPNYTGYLISSISLGTRITVNDGEVVSMRIGLSLSN